MQTVSTRTTTTIGGMIDKVSSRHLRDSNWT